MRRTARVVAQKDGVGGTGEGAEGALGLTRGIARISAHIDFTEPCGSIAVATG